MFDRQVVRFCEELLAAVRKRDPGANIQYDFAVPIQPVQYSIAIIDGNGRYDYYVICPELGQWIRELRH